jgi:hypothetical protein
MRLVTYGPIKNEVETELDLRGEDFVSPSELIAYGNDAIGDVETEIHNLGKESEYFLTSVTIPTIKGQALYDLPDNIYANKIIQILFKSPTESYEVRYLRGDHRFKRIMDASNADPYQFIIRNDSTPKIQLIPECNQSDGALVIWYIRYMNRIVDDSSVIDIPESDSYIKTKIKALCMAKENLGVMPPMMANEIENELKKLRKTLGDQVIEESHKSDDDFFEYYGCHN